MQQGKVAPEVGGFGSGPSLVNNQSEKGKAVEAHRSLEYLFLDMLHETVIHLGDECGKTSRFGIGAAFGSGLNTKKASVWLGFGKMLMIALERKPKPDEDPQEALKKEVKDLVDGINSNLNTTGIVAALIVTVVVPLFITKLAYVNGSEEIELSGNCTSPTESRSNQTIGPESFTCTGWWGNAYASVLDTVVMSMMCVAFVSAILSVSLTVAISTALNMKMVGIEDKIIFIKNHSSMLVLPNALMVVSMNLIYFALPLTLAYVQGQLKFIISVAIFFIALCVFLYHLLKMEIWCKQHIRSRCIDSLTDFLKVIENRLEALAVETGTKYVLGTHTQEFLCEKSDGASRKAMKELGERITKLHSVAVRVDSPHGGGCCPRSSGSGGSGGSGVGDCGVGIDGGGGRCKSEEG